MPIFTRLDDIQKLQQNSYERLEGHLNTNYNFYFNPKKPNSKNIEHRKRIAKFIADIRSNIKPGLGYDISRNIVTFKNKEKLDENSELSNINTDTKISIKMSLWQFIREWQPFQEALSAAAKINNIVIESTSANQDECDIHINGFVSNQVDQSGNWSFLMTDNNLLGQFESEILNKKTLENHDDIHTTVLKNYFAIPLLKEKFALFTSDRISYPHFNPFDMRVRFYEMKWNH